MKKSQLGPIFFSDIELGQKLGISRISMFRFRSNKSYSKRSYLTYVAVALVMDNRHILTPKYDNTQPIILDIANAFRRWKTDDTKSSIAEILKSSDIDKSTRSFLINSLAAMLIASNRDIFSSLICAEEDIKSGRNAVQLITRLFESWEDRERVIPETISEIIVAIASDLPYFQAFFNRLDINKIERLIFLSLWEYYNNGEDSDEKSSY